MNKFEDDYLGGATGVEWALLGVFILICLGLMGLGVWKLFELMGILS